MSSILPVPTRENIAGRIAICGAGIGGLVLAIQLRAAGLDPVVFERRSETQLRTEGVFLTLTPNGINALRAVGLAEAVTAAGLVTRGLAMFNERGKKLGLIDYGKHIARFGAPSVTIGRGVLTGMLFDAARQAGANIRLEREIDGIEEGPDAVILRSGSEETTFDMVIGCDGLRSSVRRLIFPDLPQPVYSGLIGTGGLVEAPHIASTDGIMNMTFGRKAFFGYLRMPGAPVMWFNTYPAPEIGRAAGSQKHAQSWLQLAIRDLLLPLFIPMGVKAQERMFGFRADLTPLAQPQQ